VFASLRRLPKWGERAGNHAADGPTDRRLGIVAESAVYIFVRRVRSHLRIATSQSGNKPIS
jgi:hypothetical protein